MGRGGARRAGVEVSEEEIRTAVTRVVEGEKERLLRERYRANGEETLTLTVHPTLCTPILEFCHVVTLEC